MAKPRSALKGRHQHLVQPMSSPAQLSEPWKGEIMYQCKQDNTIIHVSIQWNSLFQGSFVLPTIQQNWSQSDGWIIRITLALKGRHTPASGTARCYQIYIYPSPERVKYCNILVKNKKFYYAKTLRTGCFTLHYQNKTILKF